MDAQMANLIRSEETAVKPLQKWQVIRPTRTRRLIGDPGEIYPAGKTFFGDWILAGWVKDYDQPRWVKVADCVKVTSAEPPPPPPPDNTVMWIKSDYELSGTLLERRRPNIAGQPQTVNLACKKYGIVQATNDYIRITRELNGDIPLSVLMGTMDSWTPKGAKWGNGDFKVPCEIVFASNLMPVTSLLRNQGGLTGIKQGEWIWELDTLNFDTLSNYTAESIPSRYIMHLTLSKNGSPIVNPSPALGGRDGQPVKLLITSRSIMYIKKDLLAPVGSHTNRYLPPWDKGIIG
jgi:hypothetical protein